MFRASGAVKGKPVSNFLGLRCLLAVALFLAGCGKIDVKNYNVTVQISDGNTNYSGSSVQRFECHYSNPLFGGFDVSQCSVFGEAVVIDAGKNGVLFVPFVSGRGPSASDYAMSLFGNGYIMPSGKTDIINHEFPYFATFKDLTDPSSLRIISGNDYPDLKFVKMTINETRKQPEYINVHKYIPWIEHLKSSDEICANKNIAFKMNDVTNIQVMSLYHKKR